MTPAASGSRTRLTCADLWRECARGPRPLSLSLDDCVIFDAFPLNCLRHWAQNARRVRAGELTTPTGVQIPLYQVGKLEMECAELTFHNNDVSSKINLVCSAFVYSTYTVYI